MLFVCKWFLCFIAYSVIGWIYESTICSINEIKLINRGFLNGPLCPVYGCGALVVIFFLNNKTDDVFILFMSGAILTCIVEYLTSYILEKLFNAKWWDYSDKKFNLNGRICLLGAAVFGILTVLVIKFIHPFIYKIICDFSPIALYITSFIIFIILISDIIFTVYHLLLLNGRLAEIQAKISDYKEEQKLLGEKAKKTFSQWLETHYYSIEKIKYQIGKIQKLQYKRIFKAFPKLNYTKNKEAFEHIKEKLLNKRKK